MEKRNGKCKISFVWNTMKFLWKINIRVFVWKVKEPPEFRTLRNKNYILKIFIFMKIKNLIVSRQCHSFSLVSVILWLWFWRSMLWLILHFLCIDIDLFQVSKKINVIKRDSNNQPNILDKQFSTNEYSTSNVLERCIRVQETIIDYWLLIQKDLNL